MCLGGPKQATRKGIVLMSNSTSHQHAYGDHIAQADRGGISAVCNKIVINAGPPYRAPLIRTDRAKN